MDSRPAMSRRKKTRPTRMPTEPTSASASNPKTTDFGLRLIACFAVLWTPFFFFSSFRGHPLSVLALAYSAVLFAMVALACALLIGRSHGLRRVAVLSGLICLFLDIQLPQFDGIAALLGAVAIVGASWLLREHLALIVVVIFSTVFVSGLITPATSVYVDQSTVRSSEDDGLVPTRASGSDPAQMIVHLILDGFTGVAGIPKEFEAGQALRNEISRFFQSYQFTTAPNAISEYAASRNSISGILNFEASSTPEKHVHGKRPYILRNNAYFEGLRERGFEIAVYQSTYMDFCRETPVPLSSCFTYRYDGTDWLKTSGQSDREKLSVMLGLYLSLPGAFESAWKGYVGLRRIASNVGVDLPDLLAWDGILAPISTRSAFGTIRHSIATSPPGTAHFAHLLLPHGPYVYDEDCELRGSPFGWLSSHPLYERDNSETGRALRYPQYFDQVRCTLRDLGAFFDELKADGRWDRTELILHGDHGSRLFSTAPRTENIDELTPRDLSDGFRTLFAVKSANGAFVVGSETAPISQLLASFVGEPTKSNSGAGRPVVYLESKDDAPWTAIPWQEQSTADVPTRTRD